MKKIKNILTAILLVTSLFSCSDILDKGPLDVYSENDVWNNTDLTQAFIYSALKNATDYMIWKDNWTDNDAILESGTDVNSEQIDRYYNAGWGYIKNSVDIYGDIRRCNMVLAKMPNAPFTETEKANFIAQAKTIRAMIYFSRARLFGKLMLVKELVDAESDMTLPRTATVKETYDFILDDLKEAAPDLPVEAAAGALSRGVAYALLGEVALHGAAYIESGQDEYYRIAAKACEDLFDLGYTLDTDYKGMFNDYDISLQSNEIILAQWRSAENTNFQDTWMQRLVPNISMSKLKKDPAEKYPLVEECAGWPQMFPSVDLANAYLAIDKDGTAKEWDQTSYYKDFKANGGRVYDAIYKHRDKRFEASIVYDSCTYFANKVFLREGGNLYYSSKNEDWGMPVSGYIYRKGVYEVKRLLNDQPSNYHYVLLRLGRSYLNYAEIKLRQGDKDTAIKYINKTRTIHGGLPELPLTTSLEETWKEYKRERRVELLHESDRYWSVLRWGKADGLEVVPELTVTQKFMKIAPDGRSFEIVDLPIYKEANVRKFTKKRYLFPVPQGERDNNGNLDQNEGW